MGHESFLELFIKTEDKYSLNSSIYGKWLTDHMTSLGQGGTGIRERRMLVGKQLTQDQEGPLVSILSG